jgi:cytochrome P450
MHASEYTAPAGCPSKASRNDSKTARAAAENLRPAPGSQLLQGFNQIWQVLTRSPVAQDGVDSAPVERDNPALTTIFFLEGEAHLRRRAAIQGFFTPQAIAKRHLRVMEQNADMLMAEFRLNGEARLDSMSARMAQAVVAEIVGLTNSDIKAMAKRVAGAFDGAMLGSRGGWRKLVAPLVGALNGLQIFYFDVRPAIAARRAQRQEDVISRLLDEGRSDKEILVECITFCLAGMTTTRELMIMAAWHMLENDDLRQRFLTGDDADKTAILREILRLEPLASTLGRRTTDVVTGVTPDPIPANTRLTLDIRAANIDEAQVGACPLTLDPDRARRLKVNDTYLSFGAGEHFCPGRNVAIAEARVFLDRLLRVPGIRLVRAPDIHFLPPLLGTYELSNCIIACDHSEACDRA